MKRIFDIIVSFIGLILLSPVFLFICLIIPIESKGGIFYIQKRIGKGGVEFNLFKFRTMFKDSAEKGLITIGAKDSRITRVGYYLRKYKLDELPQLINVLAGTMSLVGPRPEVKKYTTLYSKEQQKVLSVKPGITDYASIEFSNENEILGNSSDPINLYVNEIMPKKLELNLKYISEMNLYTDLKIIFRTIFKIIS
jgi:lipopolysaccharide/colanic/teichoic acid biosynthesis glycosyltransferase